jgi:hypothetical protein
MSEREIVELKKLLKNTLQPMGEVEPRRDLWPLMLRRLDGRPLRAPWWDWALLAGVIALFFFFPGVIPALLYHL